MKRRGYTITLGEGPLGHATYRVTREDGTFVCGGGTWGRAKAEEIVDHAIRQDRAKRRGAT